MFEQNIAGFFFFPHWFHWCPSRGSAPVRCLYFDESPVVCSLSIACGAAGLLPCFGTQRSIIYFNHSTITQIHSQGKNDTKFSWANSGKIHLPSLLVWI